MDLNVPFSWGAPDPDDRGETLHIDAKDRDLAAIVKAASALSAREKSLILVLIQTVSAWGGLQDAREPA